MKKLPARVCRFFSRAAAGAVLAMAVQSGTANAYELVLTAPEAFEKRLTNASLLYAAKTQGVTEPHEIVATAQAEYKRLLSVLYADGHFGPEIHILVDGREAATLPPFETINSVETIELRINPGPQFRFGKAEIGPLASETNIPDSFTTGGSARTGIITQAATQGVRGWRNQGHAKAQVSDQHISANHRDATLDVDVTLAPGPKLRFGDLHISGSSKVSQKRLNDIISLPSGQTFSPHELDKIGKRLRRSGVFRSVSITEEDEIGPNDTLDIDIRLEDDKPHRITLGAELESRDGLSLSAAWLHRNLFGGGERLLIDGEYSGIGAQTGGTDLRLGIELTRPSTFQPDTDLSVGLNIETIDDPLFLVNKVSAHSSLTRIVNDQLTVAAGVLFEATNSQDDYGDRQFRTFGIPLRSTWDLRDDPLDPTSGYYLSGTFMPYASVKDGAPGTYVFADTRAYRKLGSDRLVAAGRFQMGSIIGPSIADTAPDYLFYTGGGGTVRGQPYQSNFVNVGGNLSGGLSLIAFSGELRFKTTETLSAVVFYDAGFVGETSNPGGAGNWQSGAGFGVRYHTSIGPIRVDLGWPVSGVTSGGMQLYIGIGQAF